MVAARAPWRAPRVARRSPTCDAPPVRAALVAWFARRFGSQRQLHGASPYAPSAGFAMRLSQRGSAASSAPSSFRRLDAASVAKQMAADIGSLGNASSSSSFKCALPLSPSPVHIAVGRRVLCRDVDVLTPPRAQPAVSASVRSCGGRVAMAPLSRRVYPSANATSRAGVAEQLASATTRCQRAGWRARCGCLLNESCRWQAHRVPWRRRACIICSLDGPGPE